ncbi:MAG: COX15/CtaA family protein [Bacteroidota bacterium]
MPKLRTGGHPVEHGSEYRVRRVFAAVTLLATVALVAWGAFVTSIKAGLAVPDWPTTFQSYDPFNPWPEWWKITPVLAEHGHRLLGMLVGVLTMILAGWTAWKDERRWMRVLGVAALLLVIVQGVLGGLRVVWVSLDLAMVHAAVAQIFFSLLAAIILFTSRRWLDADDVLAEDATTDRIRTFSIVIVMATFVQIVIGVFLRHPGTGLEPTLAALHIAGGLTVAALIVGIFVFFRRSLREYPFVYRAAQWMLGLLFTQVLLGFIAYFVILDERGVLQPSNVQVIVNSAHLVIGAFLMASTVIFALLTLRSAAPQTTASATPSISARLETA